MKKIKFLVISLLMFFTLIIGVKAEDYSEYFKDFKDDKIYVDAVHGESDIFIDILCELLNEKYDIGFDNVKTGEYRLAFLRTDDDMKIDIVLFYIDEVFDNDAYRPIEVAKKTLDVIYKETDENIANKIDIYTKKMKLKILEGRKNVNGGYTLYYNLEDLNVINYFSNYGYKKSWWEEVNEAINYSIDLKKEFENSNIIYRMDNRYNKGGEYSLTYIFGGLLSVFYDGILYDVIDTVGLFSKNVIYIPSDTPKTPEDYIEAANLKIKDYIGKEVKITKAGNLEELYNTLLNLEGYAPIDWDELDFIEEDTGVYYYKFEFENVTRYFFIVANSNRMTKKEDITFESKDLSNDIEVSTSSLIPLDTLISTNVIKDEKELNDYKEKLETDNIYAIDITLYSNSLNSYITKLDNGLFKVRMPVPESLEGKTLIVNYIDSNGTIEKHEVTVENGYLSFTTNHFSTYIVSEVKKEVINNPATGDNIILYILLSVISFLSLIYLNNRLKQVKY